MIFLSSDVLAKVAGLCWPHKRVNEVFILHCSLEKVVNDWDYFFLECLSSCLSLRFSLVETLIRNSGLTFHLKN